MPRLPLLLLAFVGGDRLDVLKLINCVVNLYFLFDLFLNFNTGYFDYKNGLWVTRRDLIAAQYIKSWCEALSLSFGISRILPRLFSLTRAARACEGGGMPTCRAIQSLGTSGDCRVRVALLQLWADGKSERIWCGVSGIFLGSTIAASGRAVARRNRDMAFEIVRAGRFDWGVSAG